MFFPPSANLFPYEPPTTRRVYDNPAVIVSAPRWPRLRMLAARATRRWQTERPRSEEGASPFPYGVSALYRRDRA